MCPSHMSIRVEHLACWGRSALEPSSSTNLGAQQYGRSVQPLALLTLAKDLSVRGGAARSRALGAPDAPGRGGDDALLGVDRLRQCRADLPTPGAEHYLHA